jgi:F-type H+-transporting ATPase subunit c
MPPTVPRRSLITDPLRRVALKRRRIVRIALVVVLVALGLFGGAAHAQTAAPAAGGSGDLLKPFAALAAGLGMAIAAGLCGLGQARAIAAALEGMARQPGAAARIQTAMIIGLALIESLAIYMLVIAIILVLVRPGL